MMSNQNFQYPAVHRNESIVEKYYGKEIADPYRWLENPHSTETKQFKLEQNDLTSAYLEGCKVRQKIHSKICELSNYNQRSCPFRRANFYYYLHSSNSQSRRALFMQNSSTGEDPVKILDPNEFSNNGNISLNTFNVSWNGKFLAFGVSKNGSDWMKICFKNLDTNELYNDILSKVKFTFSIAWTSDSNGIFYGSFPNYEGSLEGTDTTKTENQKLYYHRLGTPQSRDILVAHFPRSPNWMIGAIVSDCGNYLFLTARQGVKDNLVYYAPLNTFKSLKQDLDLKFKSLVSKFEADFTYITNVGHLTYFWTNKGAPNYRIVSVNLDLGWYNTIVAEHPKDVIDWVKCVNGDKLLICYLRNVNYFLQLCHLKDGNLIQEIPIKHGSITSYFAESCYDEFFIEIESFVSPAQVYRYNLNEDKPKLQIYFPNHPQIIDPKRFVTKQVMYTSSESVKIPMFITHKLNLKPNENTPCLLRGYGGYGTCVRAKFIPSNIVFMENFNGVIAVAHIRGGGEYGRNWHNGGRLLKKQNGFNDFQSAAKYLISNQLTSADKLTIHGVSNGGLLVGACINQRSDLFGAAIIEVGILDMLRFHKFTVGSFWCNEFGCPDSKEHFPNLFRISPLHNIGITEGGEYPAVLVLAGENDDRVVPSHSFKFIAELQHKIGQQPQQKNPLMIRIQTKAGHVDGKAPSKVLGAQTDVLAFITRALKLNFVD